ncbi:MAG: PHP domain-containing protein [Candidatus Omnitrophota bacterium]|nr:PHP domain-containing protein [Candidatus Omnitrophota bacterium]
MKYADLHVHTCYSDSTFSPEEVVEYAGKEGLAAIAICDHDSTDGIEPSMKAGAALGIEVIPSIELTVERPDTEVHILGYFIDWKKEWFQDKLKEIRNFRIDRMNKMIGKLKAMDIEVDADEVFKLAAGGSVGRPHLARVMVNAGKVKTLKEAFNKYIGYSKPCYVSRIKLSPQDVIGMVLEADGVPVLAHSKLMGKDEYIPKLIDYGLKGIEVYHTEHNASAVKRYEKLANDYNLLITGGSDCHGMNKGKALIGTVKVPYELVDKLREESLKIRHDRQKFFIPPR